MKLSRYDTVFPASDGLFGNLRLQEIVVIVRKGAFSTVARVLLETCSERMNQSNGEISECAKSSCDAGF